MLGLCCLCLLPGVVGLCRFPGFLQTNVTRDDLSPGRRELTSYRQRQPSTGVTSDDRGRTEPVRRDWRSGVRDQATSWTTTLTFDGAWMTVEREDTKTIPVDDDDDIITARSVQCECLDAVSEHRYLIRYRLLNPPTDTGARYQHEHVEPMHYACVQFVRRSASVVQLRISATTNHYNRTLCDDTRLRLENWLIVDMATVFRHSTSSDVENTVPCPLAGGFSVRVFQTASRGDQGVCDGQRRVGDTRVEADCSPMDDGQYFYFQSAACVPPGAYMYATQRTVCRASWSDDVYAYVVLTHNRLPYAWLFRYPAVLVADSFTAHLLRDLAVDDSPHATWTGGKHWRLDMVRDVQRPVTSLCVDDLDACRSLSPHVACGSTPSMTLACPRTCGVCNESRPVICTFRSDLVGDWIALTDPGRPSPTVVVGASTMTVRYDGGGVTEKFHCVTWSDRRSARQEMLVTEHFDGCRPRYTCVRYQRRAAGLLQLRLSQSRMWPLVDAVDQPVDCRAFSYVDDDTDTDDRPLRGQRFRLLYSRQPTSPTSCQLPLPLDGRTLRNYTLTYSNGTRCTNTSVEETLNGLGLLLSVGDCGRGVTPGTRTTLLHCIKSSRLSTSDGVTIVTRAASTPADVRCWFYATANPEPEMYWLAAADCGAVVRSRAERRRLIAVLSPTDHVTASAHAPHMPSDRRRKDDNTRDVANISDAPSLTSGFVSNDSDSASETEIDEEPANVFVVFAAMVIFTLLQIPCNLCQVSA